MPTYTSRSPQGLYCRFRPTVIRVFRLTWSDLRFWEPLISVQIRGDPYSYFRLDVQGHRGESDDPHHRSVFGIDLIIVQRTVIQIYAVQSSVFRFFDEHGFGNVLFIRTVGRTGENENGGQKNGYDQESTSHGYMRFGRLDKGFYRKYGCIYKFVVSKRKGKGFKKRAYALLLI